MNTVYSNSSFKDNENSIPLLKYGWYLIQCKVNEEIRACKNLNNQLIQYYCPMLKTNNKEQPMFPQYMFVFITSEPGIQYNKVRFTRGVRNFVRFSRDSNSNTMLPKPVYDADNVIRQIKEIERYHSEAKYQDQSNHFQQGEKLTLDSPLFKSLSVTFIKLSGWQRALVLLEYLQKYRDREVIHQKKLGQKTMTVPVHWLKSLEN